MISWHLNFLKQFYVDEDLSQPSNYGKLDTDDVFYCFCVELVSLNFLN